VEDDEDELCELDDVGVLDDIDDDEELLLCEPDDDEDDDEFCELDEDD